MASDAYTIVDAYDTVVTYGALASRDAYEAVILATPSNVAFPVRIVVNDNTRNDPAMLGRAIGDVAQPYAGYVDRALSLPNVTGLYSVTNFNDSNQQVDTWVVTVSSTSGNLTKQLSIPFTSLIPDRLGPLVEQATADLDALETQGA